MKVLSVLALVMFVSTHAFANSPAKPAEKPAEAAAAPAEQKAANPAAVQEGDAQQVKKPAKKKKH